MAPPPRSVNRWSVAGLALLAVGLVAIALRHGACNAATFAAGCTVGALRDRGSVRLWTLEELGVHHYTFPALLSAKEPVVLHVWLKAQRQEGKILLRRAAQCQADGSGHSICDRVACCSACPSSPAGMWVVTGPLAAQEPLLCMPSDVMLGPCCSPAP